ncbi:MAG: PAS domain S-box protein [Magnetococcales bacterium]|nr:PAS domain S-box protein [Magnetococcales bacterium]MBF0150857.1 PAS domain S-box protein [Magnetococcales bacterium]MBF0173852.1 PAS domain S-box protein [Magnetococcales bacterium]MBF0347010.1 PAS domain S-box protein [Magnetococcales bacterium]MBF0631330.1 PAS domain S-box protein [Magnetococcales bacterium]
MSVQIGYQSRSGFALLSEDDSLAFAGGAMPELTEAWGGLQSWWGKISNRIPPFPVTLCPTCGLGQQLGSIEVSLAIPKGDPDTKRRVFAIEFSGHPHLFKEETRDTLILVRDITLERLHTESIQRDIQQYESICNFIEDVYYRMDTRGHLEFISPSCVKLLGMSPADIKSRGLENICASSDYFQELLEILDKTDSVSDFGLVLTCNKGRQVPVSMTAKVVRNKKGRKIAVEGILRDITERERMDSLMAEKTRTFQESLSRLEQLQTGLNAHNVVLVTQPDGIITRVNPKACELSLYTAEELIGKTPKILDSGFQPKSFFQELWRTISQGKIWHGEMRNRNKNGGIFWLDCTIIPYLTESGRPFQYIMFGTDITHRILEHERALASRDFLQQVFQCMGEGVYAMDKEARLILMNREAEKLLGWKEEELVNRFVHEIIHSRKPDGTQLRSEDCPVHQGLLGRPFRRDDDHFIKRDNTFLPVSHVTSPLKKMDEVIGAICVFRDHTLTRQAQFSLEQHRKEAMESSRMKSVFLANMSHEIRTPMNAIVGMNDLLMDTPLNGEQYEFASIVRESSKSLLALINDILDFSKIEAGKIDIEEIDFSPVTVVEGSAELMAGQTGQKGLVLETFISPKIPQTLRGDPGRLRQMLLNLISNAVKFTEKGNITVKARMETDSPDRAVVRFMVEDTGIGLSKQGRDRLFEPFIQADGDTTRKYGGTGLGLAISKRLTELMSGTIGVESEEGKGSTFWIRIPFKLSDPEAMGKTGQLNLAPLRGARAVVISDIATDQEFLKEYFSSWGIRVTLRGTWDEGLQAIRQEMSQETPLDFIIVSSRLTDIDPRSIPHQLAAEQFATTPHLIGLLHGDDREFKVSLLDAGFESVMSKPVRKSDWVDELVELRNPSAAKPRILAVADNEPAEKHTDEPDTQEEIESGKLILLAEDNIVNQKVTLLQLKKLGYAAHAVTNGKDAVEAVMRAPYALILMDCQMPVMDGFEATHAIRRLDRSNSGHIPIIAMTANAMKGDRERCLNSGMDDYMSKPVSPSTLREKLKFWIPKGPQVAPAVDINQLRQLMGPNDAAIRELLQEFLPSATALIARLREASRSKSVAALTEAAEELREASSNMGANTLAQLSRMAENAAQVPDWAKVMETTNRLERSFRKVESFIKGF